MLPCRRRRNGLPGVRWTSEALTSIAFFSTTLNKSNAVIWDPCIERRRPLAKRQHQSIHLRGSNPHYGFVDCGGSDGAGGNSRNRQTWRCRIILICRCCVPLLL